MRLKLLALALVAAALSVSAATAAPPPGKGKPDKTGANCKPNVSIVLKGTLTSDPGASDTSFTMKVLKTNKHGSAYLKAGEATILVDAKTKVRRKGAKMLDALALNDRVNVKAKACKAELKDGATPALTARKVDAHPARPDPPDSSEPAPTSGS
jgi:hypothetical protein